MPIMEQFDINEYLENPDIEIRTKDGRHVRIVCTDGKLAEYTPVLALVEDSKGIEHPVWYTFLGRTKEDDPDSPDTLCFIKDGGSDGNPTISLPDLKFFLKSNIGDYLTISYGESSIQPDIDLDRLMEDLAGRVSER